MTLDDLNKALGDNKLSSTKLKSSSLNIIMKFVGVSLEIDKTTLDYFYEINVNELLDSEMPIEELEPMKEQGWSFSDDKKHLILYLE